MLYTLRWIATVAVLLFLGCASSVPDTASTSSSSLEGVALASPPPTIPALQEWIPASSEGYAFTSRSRIIVHVDDAASLAEAATVFASDLAALTSVTPAILPGTSATALPGDILMELDPGDPLLGDEGYALQVGPSISIRAHAPTGAFYATRTLLQWLRQTHSLGAGVARDWPRHTERGLMVDVGRKYFSMDWLRNHIKELAYLKMNYFHLHVSETQGFRLESTSHPEVVAAQHYTKDQIRELVELGQKYHVLIVPEIDMPGHMGGILESHPELQLKNALGIRDTDFIDLSLDGAYALMKDLITEYLPLFPAPFWHLGADEYVSMYALYPQLQAYARSHYGPNATGRDTYYGFINWANGIVRAAGKTTRIWNDGIHAPGSDTIRPNPNIVIEYWFNLGLTPQQHLDAGHTILNASYTPTYYVLGIRHPDDAYTYESWAPPRFQGGHTVAADEPRLRGAKAHVWCDFPNAETEQQIEEGIVPLLRSMAQQTWGSPKIVASYCDFKRIIEATGRAP
ncbi:family 20 glycosylhydrolase [Pendulispora rubella]|uniref:Family 20 glycosylhydrolase n=1 Tax=Pendulispora rubella TaxID=2741070 RepID=A0ABZ2KZN3_9BACT